MTTLTVRAVVQSDGKLVLDSLPFAAGETVQVQVSPAFDDPTEGGKYPLRGRHPYKYDDPFGPACDPDDWEFMK